MTLRSLVLRIGVKVYRLLLGLWPASSRRRYQTEMVELLVRDVASRLEHEGRLRAALALGAATADLLRCTPGEWIDHLREVRTGHHRDLRARRTQRGRHPVPDLRQTLRSLRRSPGFTAAVLVTLSLAIGANTVVFSVVDTLLLEPLAYGSAERLVTLGEVLPDAEVEPRWVSIANYLDWKSQLTGIEEMAIFRGRSRSLTGGGRQAKYVYSVMTSPELFALFDVVPFRGRSIRFDDLGPEPASVVVLSEHLWRTHFGSDPDLVGGTVEVDGVAHEVIGILPRGFSEPGEWIAAGLDVDLWLPFPLDPAATADLHARRNRSFHAAGLLAEGWDLERTRQQAETVQARLRAEHPVANRDWDLRLTPWREILTGNVRPSVLMAWAATGLLLLLACANVANLMLARTLSRRRELATRSALGAGRSELFLRLLLESALLAVAGATIGLGVAAICLRWLRSLDPGDLPLLSRVELDVRVVVVVVAVAALVTLLVGTVPALSGARSGVERLRARSSAGTSPSARRARSLLAIAQVALAFTLAIGAGLTAKSFSRLAAVPAGVESNGVLTATIALSWNRVTTLDARTRLVDQILERLRTIPGVEEAAMINSLPFSGSNAYQGLRIASRPVTDESDRKAAAIRGVSDRYFETMAIPVTQGRGFERHDLQAAVAIVNETFARQLLPAGRALGERVAIGDQGDWLEVIGVVGDVRHYGLDQQARPELYVTHARDTLTSKSFVLRTGNDPMSLAATVEAAIAEVDPDQPVRETRSFGDWVESSVAGERLNSRLLQAASAVALLLALVGVFAVLSHEREERGHELAVRAAMGAAPHQLVLQTLGRGAVIAAGGIGLGVTTSVLASRAIGGLLYDLSALDPATYAGVIAVFVAVVLLAAYLPARRVGRADPVDSLRAD